jgi:hypothetical protein
MINATRKKQCLAKLAGLYERMQAAYADLAGRIGLSCAGCPSNCCDSHFQHHTYIEWLYLWQGVRGLDPARRAAVLDRAADNVRQAGAILAQGLRPRLMCPLNESGLCGLYGHRLMICRLHGVPNFFDTPRGRQRFPGCFRCAGAAEGAAEDVPALDRTPLYRELAGLEMELLGTAVRTLPRVNLTLSELLVQGEPRL